jgi:hypothetical protein
MEIPIEELLNKLSSGIFDNIDWHIPSENRMENNFEETGFNI